MKTIEIKTPDGKTLEVNAPDGATPEQIHQAAQAAARHYQSQGVFKQPSKPPVPIQATATPPAQPSMMGRAWNALAIPEQKSREGLQMIANSIPSQVPLSPSSFPFPTSLAVASSKGIQNPNMTGNVVTDTLKGIPKIAAETLAETAPGFISRGAIVTAGALKGLKLAAPAIKAVGRGVARGAEALSGLEYKTPGILTEAATKGGILTAPGAKSASPIYEAAKGGEKVNKTLARISGKKEFVEKAYELAEKGKLNPLEALEARKELGALKKNITGEFFRKATEKFNEIAKPVFQEADTVFSKGLRADELRRILPVNKSGGTSIAKTVLSSLLGPLGTAMTSPIVQGTVATGIGKGARAVKPLVNNPVTTAGVVSTLKLTKEKAKEFLRKAKNDKEKATQLAIEAGYDPYQ